MKKTSLPLLPLVLDRVPRGMEIALSQEGVPWVSRKMSAIAGRFVLYDSRATCNHGRQAVEPMPISPDQTRIDVDELRTDGPADPFETLVDDRAVWMAWDLASHGLAGTTVSEEVSRYDKRAVRDRLLRRLRQRIESHGGVWLRLSPVPFPYRTAFHLRIDHDGFVADDFHRLLDTLAGHEDAVTHYLNGRALENFSDDAVARLRGLDVGSHGYYHHTYRTESENVRNIQRGIDTIARHGLDPIGFVAPHGRYNRSLEAAMTSLGVSHAGEFGLAYDDWPFWPTMSQDESAHRPHDVLQIPVHPICLGLFGDGDDGPHAPHAWLDYLTREAEARYRAGEPLFFYDHPNGALGRHAALLAEFLATIGQMETLWKTTARRMAEWWRVRAMVRLSVCREGDEIVVRREGPRPKFRLAVELFRDQHSALVAMEQPELRLSPESIVWQRRGSLDDLSRPVGRRCPLGLRDRFKQAIDWEKETPLDELPVTGWRGWCKKFLRKK